MSITAINEIHNDFMVYAKEVNESRAFPDVRDGLKPSMRACLWEMYSKGFTSNKPHVKSAKVDGAVIGEIWPHGSVYETFARMSQPWVNNIPEVDWHGANGSQLGGPQPAASRYTECRLSKASEDGFFSNIKKNVVDFQLNFSEDLEWPTVLPSIFPRLFVNGSQGIGYTIAQEWEPGNLTEFVQKVKTFINTNKIDGDDIYPDYPTGGVIINKRDIHTIYETGKGTVILRAKTKIDGNLIKITELPYQVYAEPLIQEIKDLVNSDKISGIEDIYNKSGDDGLLIEVECSGDPEYILNRLFKLTNLQCTFSANQMALKDGVPEMFTLKDYVEEFIKNNILFLEREYTFDLNKAQERKEVVDGLLKAIINIDAIITLIKSSKSSQNAKEKLIKDLGYTSNQAQAIVDMKLGKLANLESVELNKEASELDKTIKNCNKFLSSKKMKQVEFLKRLDDFTSKYGWTRRTQVTDVDLTQEKIKTVKVRSKEEFMIALGDDNTIRRIKLSNFSNRGKNNIISTEKLPSKGKVVLISNKGMMYKLVINKISLGTMSSSGDDLSTLLNLSEGEKIIQIYSTLNKDYILFITKEGLVKKLKTDDCLGVSKNGGATIMKLSDSDEIIWLEPMDDQDSLVLKTNKREITIKAGDYNTKGRKAGGVKLKLKKNEYLDF